MKEEIKDMLNGMVMTGSNTMKYVDAALDSAMESLTEEFRSNSKFDQRLLESDMFMTDLRVYLCTMYATLFTEKAFMLQSDYMIECIPKSPEEGEKE